MIPNVQKECTYSTKLREGKMENFHLQFAY